LQYLLVKNWEAFQHYHDRAPPWIKLHRTLLDDFEFSELPDDSKAHLMLIWVLAAGSGGRVPASPKFLQSKIGAKRSPDVKLLVEKGFLIVEQSASTMLDASNDLATREHDASGTLPLARGGALSSPLLLVSRKDRKEIAREDDLAEPLPVHRELAAKLGVDCDSEWAAFNERVEAKGPWFKKKAPAFSGWLRMEAKFAQRDGRLRTKQVKRVVA
jgi:hypothetical protein